MARRTSTRRRRRRSTARRRHHVMTYAPRRRRRRRHTSYSSNPPRRSHRRRHRRRSYAHHNAPRRRRRGFGGGGGGFIPSGITGNVVAGVGAGLLLMYGGPWAARLIGQPSSGLMYRGVQAAVAIGAGWGAKRFGLLSAPTANAVVTYGLVFVAMGALSDFMAGGTVAAAAPAPSEIGLTGGMGYYEPYGPGLVPYGQTMPGMGYYDAVS